MASEGAHLPPSLAGPFASFIATPSPPPTVPTPGYNLSSTLSPQSPNKTASFYTTDITEAVVYRP